MKRFHKYDYTKWKDVRQSMNLTQSEFANLLGVAVQQYSQTELGNTTPSVRMLIKHCNLLYIRPRIFFPEVRRVDHA